MWKTWRDLGDYDHDPATRGKDLVRGPLVCEWTRIMDNLDHNVGYGQTLSQGPGACVFWGAAESATALLLLRTYRVAAAPSPLDVFAAPLPTPCRGGVCANHSLHHGMCKCECERNAGSTLRTCWWWG